MGCQSAASPADTHDLSCGNVLVEVRTHYRRRRSGHSLPHPVSQMAPNFAPAPGVSESTIYGCSPIGRRPPEWWGSGSHAISADGAIHSSGPTLRRSWSWFRSSSRVTWAGPVKWIPPSAEIVPLVATPCTCALWPHSAPDHSAPVATRAHRPREATIGRRVRQLVGGAHSCKRAQSAWSGDHTGSMKMIAESDRGRSRLSPEQSFHPRSRQRFSQGTKAESPDVFGSNRAGSAVLRRLVGTVDRRRLLPWEVAVRVTVRRTRPRATSSLTTTAVLGTGGNPSTAHRAVCATRSWPC